MIIILYTISTIGFMAGCACLFASAFEPRNRWASLKSFAFMVAMMLVAVAASAGRVLQ